MIIERGYIPSLCTSCYRSRRTGNAFTEMAVDGRIRGFCLPNALLSLAEYAVATEDSGLRGECLAAIGKAREEISGSPLAGEFDRKIEAVLAGEKDRHF